MMPISSDDLLLQAFIQEAKEHGIANVTIAGIGHRGNCTRQTVYYHYGNIMNFITNAATRHLPKHCIEAEEYSGWMRNLFILLKNLSDYDWLFKDVENSKYRDGFNEFIKTYCHEKITIEIVASCADYGNSKSRAAISKIVTYCIGGYIIDWLHDGLSESVDETMLELNRLCGAAMRRLIEDYLVLRPADTRKSTI